MRYTFSELVFIMLMCRPAELEKALVGTEDAIKNMLEEDDFDSTSIYIIPIRLVSSGFHLCFRSYYA